MAAILLDRTLLSSLGRRAAPSLAAPEAAAAATKSTTLGGGAKLAAGVIGLDALTGGSLLTTLTGPLTGGVGPIAGFANTVDSASGKVGAGVTNAAGSVLSSLTVPIMIAGGVLLLILVLPKK
jgi:hypothetical protein